MRRALARCYAERMTRPLDYARPASEKSEKLLAQVHDELRMIREMLEKLMPGLEYFFLGEEQMARIERNLKSIKPADKSTP